MRKSWYNVVSGLFYQLVFTAFTMVCSCLFIVVVDILISFWIRRDYEKALV